MIIQLLVDDDGVVDLRKGGTVVVPPGPGPTPTPGPGPTPGVGGQTVYDWTSDLRNGNGQYKPLIQPTITAAGIKIVHRTPKTSTLDNGGYISVEGGTQTPPQEWQLTSSVYGLVGQQIRISAPLQLGHPGWMYGIDLPYDTAVEWIIKPVNLQYGPGGVATILVEIALPGRGPNAGGYSW